MSTFTAFCESYFKKYFELHPIDAIYYGVVGYDHLLNDYSDESYVAEKALVEEALTALDEIAPQELSPDEAIDYTLLKGKLTIQSYAHKKEDYRLKWPDTYSPIEAIYILTVRDTNDFSGNVLSRLNRSASLIQQGITNLSRRTANPPKLWTKMALEGAKGALANFAEFLERDLLPRSSGVYAVGVEHYELLLHHKHFLDVDAQALLHLGEELFARTKRELIELTAAIAPGKSIEAAALTIQENHPSTTEVLSAYQKAMEAARQFVKENSLVSFPPREELHVVPTPEFRCHEIPFAAYLSPSPRDPAQVGYYYVTPVRDDDLLREHNWVGLENTSVHESYPGHHLQFSLANSIPAASTLPRLMNESSVFYEGWALYCEQLMQEEGFLKTKEHRFVMLKDRLWRALRIIIDVKTQTGRMTYDEAADLMVRELHFPRAQACGDLNWYSQSPAVPMGYALGWTIINRLRDQEKHRLGSKFNLREFHDKLLSAGSISLPLVEKRHFKYEA